MRLLLVEPDSDYVTMVNGLLRKHGWEVETAAAPAEAVERTANGAHDLLIVDADAGAVEGIPLITRLRSLTQAPIVALVNAANAAEGVSAIEQGANYDLAKPFSPRQLQAAIVAVCSNTAAVAGGALPERFGANGHLVTLVRHEVQVDGRRVVLSPREYALFSTLAAHPGRSFSRDELVTLSWGSESGRPSPRQVDVYVGYLRRKLEPDPKHPRFILTDRGAGYRWRWDEEWEHAEEAEVS